ncbi:MAG: hypothetical protein HFH42_06665 [Lachnospiraceae bacterium]|nr:hypothetical protein [Lachnospiraceae bacterium]
MGKQNKNSLILRYIALFCITAAAWVLLKAGGGFHAALSFLKNMEIEEVYNSSKNIEAGQGHSSSTSINFRYGKQFQDTLSHYRYFSSLYQEGRSTAVPGLESTEILGESCNQMVPQGICIAGDYMLVTAYDNGGSYGKGGHKPNHSVIYVLSNQNARERKFLTTIVLPDVNHVGGIAFDGENIWIAKSTDRECSVISYEAVQEAVGSGKSSYQLEEYGQNVFCGAVASFVTWYGNRLWVGTYSNRVSNMGSLRSYLVKKEGSGQQKKFTLEKQEEIVIPGYANGVAFWEQDGKPCMAVATSKGRYFDSQIYLYQVYQDSYTGRNIYYCYNSCKFPPMAEELVCDGENMYFLFESSATCYSTQAYQKCSYPVDRVCAVPTRKLFWQNQREVLRGSDGTVQKPYATVNLELAYQERKYWRQ